MTVKSGATLILKFDKDRDYAFTKPIYPEGGTIEINGGGGSGIIKGLDVRGKGYRDLPRGTVSGDVEKTVKVVMDNETYSSGNIDIPDYGNVVDGTGNTVHKFAYKAETEYDYFRRVCIIREVEERIFFGLKGNSTSRKTATKCCIFDGQSRPSASDRCLSDCGLYSGKMSRRFL